MLKDAKDHTLRFFGLLNFGTGWQQGKDKMKTLVQRTKHITSLRERKTGEKGLR